MKEGVGDQYCMESHLWEKVSKVEEYIHIQNMALLGCRRVIQNFPYSMLNLSDTA